MLAKSTYFHKAENRLLPLVRPAIPQSPSPFYNVSKDLDTLYMKTSLREKNHLSQISVCKSLTPC